MIKLTIRTCKKISISKYLGRGSDFKYSQDLDLERKSFQDFVKSEFEFKSFFRTPGIPGSAGYLGYHTNLTIY